MNLNFDNQACLEQYQKFIYKTLVFFNMRRIKYEFCKSKYQDKSNEYFDLEIKFCAPYFWTNFL